MARQYLINPHSFTKDKHASAATSTIQYGEIAVNCNSESPKLYIKTATGATATGSNIKWESFSPDSVLDSTYVKKYSTDAHIGTNIASYISRKATETGTLKISLPFKNTSNMVTFEILVYEYDGVRKGPSKIIASAYNWTDGTAWGYGTAVITGRYDRPIRFAYDGDKSCILLGNTTDTWSYPQIFVTKMYNRFGADSNVFKDGYSISFVTSESGISGVTICSNYLAATTVPYSGVTNVPTATTSTHGIVKIDQTTANNYISTLLVGDSAPTDNTWYITSVSSGTGTTFYKRPHSLLADYLKSKLSTNFLNLTGGTMTGTITSRNITPSSNATYSLGTSSSKYKEVHVSNTVGVGNSTISYNATTGCMEIVC